MLRMRALWCVSVLALCLRSVTSDDSTCDNITLAAPLGSSVLLPCSFPNASWGWTWWVQTPGLGLIQLSWSGRIDFLDPLGGRLKAFPLQIAERNYSIRIDELQASDLGLYHCRQNQPQQCVQLLLQEASGSADSLTKEMLAGIGLGALLLLVGWLFFVYRVRQRRLQNQQPGS